MKKGQFLYKQIYDDIKDKINQKVLEEGTCLPASHKLAEEYGVSTITVTSALNALKEAGYLIRIKGKGSFVKLPKDQEPAGESIISGEESEVSNSEAANKEGCHQKIIGLVLEHVSSCFGLDMLYAMDQCAQEAGYRLCIRFSYGDREKETEEINFLKELGARGLIVMPCHGKYYNTGILKLVIEHFPMVLIDKQMEGIPVSSVRTDNYGAMKALVDYLASQGKKRIGFITAAESGTSSVKDRRKGFWDAIKAAGLERMPECFLETDGEIKVFSDEFDFKQAEAMEQYLKENEGLDAVVCVEYGVAKYLGMFKTELNRRGIKVCCMDENYLSPGNERFTHVKQDERKIASCAVRLLIHQMEGGMEAGEVDYLVPGIFKEC